MESFSSFFLTECVELPPYSSSSTLDSDFIKLSRLWHGKIDQLASRKLSWEDCFGMPAADFCKDETHPVFQIRTTHEGHNLLHLAIYQKKLDWIDSLLKIPSLILSKNRYGLTPPQLSAFLGQQDLPFKSLESKAKESEFLCNPKIQGTQYLRQPEFETEELFHFILGKVSKANQEDVIPPVKIWLGVHFDKEIQTGYHSEISLHWINKKIGFGIFADQRILSCSFVGEYTGVIRESKKKYTTDNYHYIPYPCSEIGSYKFIIDASKKGNFTRFINHSDTPNLVLHPVYWRSLPRMIFLALREIQKGEELTFNYGNISWKRI